MDEDQLAELRTKIEGKLAERGLGETPQIENMITPDQEAWVKARIETAIDMALALKARRKVEADSNLFDFAIAGLVEGTAFEIIYTLGLRPCHVNLSRYGRMFDRISSK